MVIDTCTDSHRIHLGGSTRRVWLHGLSFTLGLNRESRISMPTRQPKYHYSIEYIKIKATDADYA